MCNEKSGPMLEGGYNINLRPMPQQPDQTCTLDQSRPPTFSDLVCSGGGCSGMLWRMLWLRLMISPMCAGFGHDLPHCDCGVFLVASLVHILHLSLRQLNCVVMVWWW